MNILSREASLDFLRSLSRAIRQPDIERRLPRQAAVHTAVRSPAKKARLGVQSSKAASVAAAVSPTVRKGDPRPWGHERYSHNPLRCDWVISEILGAWEWAPHFAS